MLFGFDFSLIALVGIVLLIGIVKRGGLSHSCGKASRSVSASDSA
jgi:hypothetical protein